MLTDGHPDGSGPSGDRGRPVGPATMVHVRVDHQALRRGHIEPGEVCEIPGIGPIPVDVARRLAADSVLSVLVTDGIDVTAVAHAGRTIPAAFRRGPGRAGSRLRGSRLRGPGRPGDRSRPPGGGRWPDEPGQPGAAVPLAPLPQDPPDDTASSRRNEGGDGLASERSRPPVPLRLPAIGLIAAQTGPQPVGPSRRLRPVHSRPAATEAARRPRRHRPAAGRRRLGLGRPALPAMGLGPKRHLAERQPGASSGRATSSCSALTLPAATLIRISWPSTQTESSVRAAGHRSAAVTRTPNDPVVSRMTSRRRATRTGRPARAPPSPVAPSS